MKINIDTISTAVYAIRKNFQGYKLLKNPKGAPPTEINMMKSSFGVYGIYFDDCFQYHRIQRKFDENGEVLVEKVLSARHFVNRESNLNIKKKNLSFYKLENGRAVVSKEKMLFYQMIIEKE